MQHRILALLVLVFFFTLSCKKEKDPAPIPTYGQRVFAICEGLYGSGNSALTLYLPDSGSSIADAYYAANNQYIGDVFQSMTLTTQGQYLLCINNSDRILAIDKTTLLIRGSITIPKPRYIVQVSPTKAFVSAMYSPNLYVINPANLSITDTISLPYLNPEGMCLRGDKLFVATWDTASSFIYQIDIATNKVGAPISVAGRAPQEILEDKEGMLWVLSGNNAKGKVSALTRINPTSGSTLNSYFFGPNDPVRLVSNPAKDTIYFIEVNQSGTSPNNGVYRMGIHDAALPSQAFIQASGLQYFWALGVHPGTGHVYVGDPKGFTQQGTVSIYRQDGSRLTSFATGVGPGHFFFE